MSKQTWFSIKNSAGEGQAAEIFIYGEIGDYGLSAAYFISQLKALAGQDLDLRICSIGGSVFDGMAIYSAIDRHTGTVIAHVDGIAASIASVIAMAADVVHMPANALLMIHNPSGIELGTADDMRKTADLLDKVKDTIVACYTAKTNLDAKVVGKMMDDESWMTAAEAFELGFIDYIDAPEEMTASAGKIAPRVDSTVGGVKLTDLLNKIAGGKAPKNDATEPAPTPAPTPAPELKKEGEPDPKPADDKKEGEPKPGEEKKEGQPENKGEDLKNSVTRLTNELKTEREKTTKLTNRVTELEGEIRDASVLANQIVAGMPLDTPLPKPAAKEGADGAPATSEEFVKGYRNEISEKGPDAGSSYYAKFGPKFGF